ncbi:MAG: hypothetical protein KDC80_09110 [Saprospiraceae bacterium]|nr:hypothetical protein [Saprospiraceae bacterium]
MHRIKRYQKIVNNFWSSLKRSRRIIIFLIITLSSLAPVRGQLFPVTATVNVTTPALPTYLHQWYQSLTLNAPLQINLQFNDLDNAPLNARVQIYLDGPGISIASDPNLPTIVTLEPGQIITLDGAALATLFSVDRLATAGTGQNSLPEGVYTLCVEVYELLRNTKISNTACTAVTVQRFDVPEWRPIEPVYQLPDDDYTLGIVSLHQSPFFTLNWSPRHPQVFMAEYELEIFAQPKSSPMTPDQVVNSTFPFFRTTTFGTTYLYQLSDPPLDSSQIYLTRIKVRDPLGFYQFINNGIGPVGTFTVSGGWDLPSGSSPCADPNNRPQLSLTIAGEAGIDLTWEVAEYFQSDKILVQSRYSGDTTGWRDQGWYPAVDGGVAIFGSELPADRYRVGLQCPDGSMLWSNTVSTIPFPEVLPDSCGIPVDLQNENTDPLDHELLNGDSILAGDFILVLEDVYFNGLGYNGFGSIATPFFNIVRPRIAVELINVQVNSDFRMMGGLVNTIYDTDDNLLINIGDLRDLFAEIGGIDDLAYDLEEFSDSIVMVRINTNGATEVITLDSLGQEVIHTFPLSLKPPEGISTLLVRDGYELAGDVFVDSEVSGPTTYIGTDGKIYGQVDQSVYVESDLLTSDLEENLGELGTVSFEKHPEEPGGLDPYFPEASLGDYGHIEDYHMPWKALLLGTSERVLVDRSQTTADSFFFETHSGYRLTPRMNGDKLEVDVPAINDGDLDALYVLGQSLSDPALHTLGGMKVASYPLKLLSVNIIPINGAEVPVDAATLATGLNKIYNPAIASWQVKILENQEVVFDENEDGILATGKGTTGQFNKEMRNVAQALDDLIQKGSKDSPVLTIVVVPRLDAEYDGYMPRGRNLGFVRSNASDFIRVVAHELGHGAFGLQHSWDEYPDLAKGTSDNLMDYGSGTRLTKRQWDQIHTPLAVLGLFETSESGGSVLVDTKGKPIGDYFGDLITDGLFIPFLTPGHSRIILSKSVIDPVFFHGIESDESQDIFTGSLIQFTDQGKEYIAKFGNGTFYGYYNDQERYPAEIPDSAGTRSKELISIVYPCGEKLFAQSFSAQEIKNYTTTESRIVSELETDLRFFTGNKLYNSISFKNIQGLFTSEQTGISTKEVEMTKDHCGKETSLIVSKISQYRNRYPVLFEAFTENFDRFFEVLALEEAPGSEYNLLQLGEFERMLRDDPEFYTEMSSLWKDERYRFYIRFLEELKILIKRIGELKTNCLSNIEQAEPLDLYNCIKYYSNDELMEIGAISKYLIIEKFIDAFNTSNQYEKQIIRLITYFQDAEQADELYSLLRNDLTSSDGGAIIKRLFYGVDDAIIFGPDDRKDLIRSIIKLCASSESFRRIAEERAGETSFEKFTYVYFYQSIWQDIIESSMAFAPVHIECDGSFNEDGNLFLEHKLQRGFIDYCDLTQLNLHALDPILFLNQSKLGQLSEFDSRSAVVPALVAMYAVSTGDMETTRDLVDAAIDILSLTVGAGAIKLGISGLRKAIILADMVSSGITLTINVTDADENLNEDALSLLRTMALISGLIGAGDILPIDNITELFQIGQKAVHDAGFVDNVSDLRKEAGSFCDQINNQENLDRFAELGQNRLEIALFQNEKLLEASQLAEDVTLTTKLKQARERLLRVINDLDADLDFLSLLASRFPVLAKSENADLLNDLVQLLNSNPDLRGLIEIGSSLNSAAKGLTNEKQLLLFRYLVNYSTSVDVLLALPHLFRFEPWSWPTGPPSLVDQLSLLRQKDPTIFDELLKEGGKMLIGLDLSGDATANALKVQRFCADLVQNNALVAFFEESVGRIRAWEAVKHLNPKIKLEPSVLGKIDEILSGGVIPEAKFRDALNKQFGEILDAGNDVQVNKILDRLKEAHVNDKHFDEIVLRFDKYPEVTQELKNFPDQFEFFDEVLRFPEQYRELAQVGSIQTSSPLYKWALGKFRNQILHNAGKLEDQVSADIGSYVNIPNGYGTAKQVHLKGSVRTVPDDFIYSKIVEVDPATGVQYYRAIIHDTKLHQDVPWTPNQFSEIIEKFEQGAKHIDLELRTIVDEQAGLIPGATIRIHKSDVFKSIGSLDKSGTYLSTSKVF